MSKDPDKEGRSDVTSDKINAVANLAKAIPLYDDALKPLAVETGRALETVGRTVNLALAPVKGLIWGGEAIQDWVAHRVAAKLANTPEDQIVTPDISVAGPVLEGLRFNGQRAEISEMFASLLAGAMSKNLKDDLHPSFVECVKSLSALDARLFEFISRRNAVATITVVIKSIGLEGENVQYKFICPEFVEIAASAGATGKEFVRVQAGIENLHRLGLIDADGDGFLTSVENKQRYDRMIDGPFFAPFRNTELEPKGEHTQKFQANRTYVRVTQFGKDFANVVLIPDA